MSPPKRESPGSYSRKPGASPMRPPTKASQPTAASSPNVARPRSPASDLRDLHVPFGAAQGLSLSNGSGGSTCLSTCVSLRVHSRLEISPQPAFPALTIQYLTLPFSRRRSIRPFKKQATSSSFPNDFGSRQLNGSSLFSVVARRCGRPVRRSPRLAQRNCSCLRKTEQPMQPVPV